MLPFESLKSSGLVFSKTGVSDGGFDLVLADHVIGGVVVSRYVFLELTADDINRLAQSEGEFAEFENEKIAPLYYDLTGDLSWSMYLVLVIPDLDLERVSDGVWPVVENSRRYARKIIVSASALPMRIPVSLLSLADFGSPDTSAANPLDDWNEVLGSAGLDFCLRSYSSEALNAYVRGQQAKGVTPRRDIQATEKTEDINSVGYAVGRLDLGTSFRPHCFGKNVSMTFGAVNILDGSNGSGKTSILDAIELLVTGSNRSREAAPAWDGQICFRNGTSLRKPAGPPERKERERRFYRHKEKKTDRLNASFRQYNYISLDDVHEFCHGSQPDYSEAVSTVLFGEEVSSMQAAWTTYLSRFIDLKSSLNDSVCELFSHIGQVEDRILAIKEAVGAVASVSVEPYLRLIGFEQAGFELTTTNGFSKANDTVAQLSTLGAIITEPGSLSFSEILQLTETARADYIDLTNSQTKNRNLLSDLTAKRDSLLLDRNANRTTILKMKEDEEQLRGLLAAVRSIRALFDCPDLVAEFRSAETVFVESRRLLELMDRLNGSWGWLKTVPSDLVLPSIDVAEQERQAILGQLERERSSVADVQRQLEVATQTTKKLERLLAELQSVGRDVIALRPNSRVCPLCGLEHPTPDTLALAINASVGKDDIMGIILKSLSERQTEVERLVSVLAQVEEAIRVLSAMDAFGLFLTQHEDHIGVTLPDMSVAACQMAFSRIDELNTKCSQRRLEAEYDMQRLGVLGVSNETIAKREEVLQGLALVGANPDLGDLAVQLMELLEESSSAQLVVQRRGLDCDKDSADLNIRIEHIKSNLQLDSREIELSSVQLGRYDAWCNSINRIKDIVTSLRLESTVSEWQGAVSRLNHLIMELHEASILTEELEKTEKELVEQHNEVPKIQRKLTNCLTAIAALKALKTTDRYVTDYLAEHVSRISDLFLLLHAPREFSGLILESGKLMAKRQNSSKTSSVTELSSGQRVAFVLSVFFVNHMSMPTAFPFVLLDEPLANLDDLNALSFLDFLRQLQAVRGTQIIVTTANPSVASLFRRKFSFLGPQFTSFRFSRSGASPTRIVARQYAPDKEDELNARVVS